MKKTYCLRLTSEQCLNAADFLFKLPWLRTWEPLYISFLFLFAVLFSQRLQKWLFWNCLYWYSLRIYLIHTTVVVCLAANLHNLLSLHCTVNSRRSEDPSRGNKPRVKKITFSWPSQTLVNDLPFIMMMPAGISGLLHQKLDFMAAL